MKTIKLLSAASGAVLALSVASSGIGPSAAEAQGYGPPPPPPPSYAPPPPPYRPPPGYEMPDKSMLKVCKVAGIGVNVGDPYTFHAKPAGRTESIPVPAGPAPDGYCQIVGIYETGTVVDLYEYLPRGYGIESIKVHPANARVQADLLRGKIVVKLGRGVTEVTLVNISVEPGWFEICKKGARDNQVTEFSYIGVNGPVTQSVHGNSCTPARQVPAGEVVVTESAGSGPMVGGEVWPEDRRLGVDPGRREIRAVIPPAGTIETQTIITFVNRAQPGKGY